MIVVVAAAGAWPGGCTCSATLRLEDATPHLRADPSPRPGRLTRPLELGGRARLDAVLSTDMPEAGIALDEARIVDGDSVQIEIAGEASLDVTTRTEGETTVELTMGDTIDEVVVEVAASEEVRIAPAGFVGAPVSAWPASAAMVAGSEALFERESVDASGRLLSGTLAVDWQVDGDATLEEVADAPALVRVVAGTSDFRLRADATELAVSVVDEADVAALQLWRDDDGTLDDGGVVAAPPAAELRWFAVPVTADGDWVVGTPGEWTLALDSPTWTATTSSTCARIECPPRLASVFAALEPGSRATATIALGPLRRDVSAIVE